jgi:hypothetical protein
VETSDHKFKLNIKVTNSGNSKLLLKIMNNILGLPASKITKVGNFANSYKVMPSDSQIHAIPPHQALSTDHMTMANVDNISCLTFPFFDVDKKDGKKKII